jgi:hypothetical protein
VGFAAGCRALPRDYEPGTASASECKIPPHFLKGRCRFALQLAVGFGLNLTIRD